MAYIKLHNNAPGISGLLEEKPETAKPLRALAHILLHSPSTLEVYERELIASYVSYRNECSFCYRSHAAVVNHIQGSDALLIEVLQDPATASVSEKLRALLQLADKVRQGGRFVTAADIDAARAACASDDELHDTVLIAAAFCMYNRYVDGLGTFAPPDMRDYSTMGARLATEGYLRPAGSSDES